MTRSASHSSSPQIRRNGPRRVQASAAVLVLALPLLLALPGCGKKPSMVSPPEGTSANMFPSTYPNPKYDPKPTADQAIAPAAAPGVPVDPNAVMPTPSPFDRTPTPGFQTPLRSPSP